MWITVAVAIRYSTLEITERCISVVSIRSSGDILKIQTEIDADVTMHRIFVLFPKPILNQLQTKYVRIFFGKSTYLRLIRLKISKFTDKTNGAIPNQIFGF